MQVDDVMTKKNGNKKRKNNNNNNNNLKDQDYNNNRFNPFRFISKGFYFRIKLDFGSMSNRTDEF